MLGPGTGAEPPAQAGRGPAGTFPVVAWRVGDAVTWGLEAIALSAGTCVQWLAGDLGIVDDVADTDALAATCEDAGDVWFVPAFLGLGTPVWDFGARGALLGVTQGTGRAELARAVLEGDAHRGADLLEAAEEDGAARVATLRADGGMSANGVFVQALADACGRPVELSRELEATTLGAGLLAGLAVGTWADADALADLESIVHPVVRAQTEAVLRVHADTDDVVVLDLPLLAGRDGRRAYELDGVLVVDAPEDLALERLVRDRHMDPSDARARMAAQPGRPERLREADFVVMNLGSRAELEAMVARAWAWIARLRAERGGVAPARDGASASEGGTGDGR